MLNFGNKEFRNLQEQVLKNAQDIETLKGRENLQVVIVEELPEEGNPNYIYLVPNNDEEELNVYDEYIWLADAEEYEKIGGLSIDTTNFVTVDSTQTISGVKTFDHDVTLYSESGDSPALVFQRGTNNDSMNDWRIIDSSGYLRFSTRTTGAWQEIIQVTTNAFQPTANNSKDLGVSGTAWKDLYLSGTVYHTSYNISWDNGVIFKNSSNITLFYIGSNGQPWIYGDLIPAGTSGTKDLGNSTHYFKDLHLTGNISDGANTVSVANIASKVTSTFISGTFDANGESTIDTEQAGTPEGLFIFTYGNCECFVRLTATMVQNADVTPIRVACPMITSGSPYLGWLEIERSATTLTISVKDGNIHVDSGYAWTLTKTNLL